MGEDGSQATTPILTATAERAVVLGLHTCVMIPPQVHLRRPCYDFYFL
ncbi:hypothetical protein GMOD_00009807 [Pyrenophora seminiperda CCB06]|uniref:Uncharacterized protein n=1 Tax=Pyrenophora seminiperda CCB06 TaxID=1302712 RepID=A0A3M7MEI9_9PLEO|nr:hypothetical protein GMOD_00009807 [Pyrenophora seminiperda CCB06]